VNKEKLTALLYEALETEMGGVEIYETALRCATNVELKEEWQKYLAQTRNHVEIMRDILGKMKLDPEKQTPGRKVVGHIGKSLVKAMEMAMEAADPSAAQIVAAECVTLAETKDHLNWELMSQVVKKAKTEAAAILKDPVEQVEGEEDEHLYHTAGWTRELWIESLGMPAVLPPPEEEKDVKSAIGAERAKQSRDKMVQKPHAKAS
jgi:hypothetical protein